ncbi:MAG: regulatory protein RecX [Archangium sp.]|nr:regulatory protein RecX [Archangium sp.]
MRKLSEKSLGNVALHYLRKHSASRKGLVQLLERKIKRQGDVPLSEAKVIIDQVVARMVQAGYLDDARMAESKTASLHRQGKSSRVIELKLREKGIDPALARKSAITTPEVEFESAGMLVKRKRLGVDPERKQKDFAVLMRAGFSSDVARRALQAAAEASPVGELIQFPGGAQAFDEGDGEECRVLPFPIQASDREKPDRGLEAAAGLVEKKRLGLDPSRKQRDLAVLIRAGFNYDVAKLALLR